MPWKVRHELCDGFKEPVFDMPRNTKTLYAAGGEGFNDTTRGWMNEMLIPTLEGVGFNVISPWELTEFDEINQVEHMPSGAERERAAKALRQRVADRNHRGMEQADFMIASLEGPVVDDGTAAEIGAFVMMHKSRVSPPPTVVGYRTDLRRIGDLGGIVNLQVEYYIDISHGRIVESFNSLYQSAVDLMRDGRLTP